MQISGPRHGDKARPVWRWLVEVLAGGRGLAAGQSPRQSVHRTAKQGRFRQEATVAVSIPPEQIRFSS